MPKKHISSLIVSSVAALSETLCFSSSLFKVPLQEYPVSSDWSAHTRLSQRPQKPTDDFYKNRLMLLDWGFVICVQP